MGEHDSRWSSEEKPHSVKCFGPELLTLSISKSHNKEFTAHTLSKFGMLFVQNFCADRERTTWQGQMSHMYVATRANEQNPPFYILCLL